MTLRPILAVLASAVIAGCTVHATATTPQPNVMPPQSHVGSVKIDTSAVPAGPLCSSHPGLKDFCVEQLRPAIDGGLTSMLGRYITGGAGPSYSAVFRLIEFSHSPASGGTHVAVQVAMRWQFELLDGNRRIVQLAQNTVGPEALINVNAGDKAVYALLNAVLENIASELNKAAWESAAPGGPPPAAAPAS
jgi:hypothetical protein